MGIIFLQKINFDIIWYSVIFAATRIFVNIRMVLLFLNLRFYEGFSVISQARSMIFLNVLLSTPQDVFWKHHEAILPLQWICVSHKGGRRIFEGLVWSQFLYYIKNNFAWLFFALIKHFLCGGKNFINFFLEQDRPVHNPLFFYFKCQMNIWISILNTL